MQLQQPLKEDVEGQSSRLEVINSSFEEWTESEHEVPSASSWVPSISAFILSIIGISPFLSFALYKFGFTSVLYMLIHLVTAPIALRLQDSKTGIRWLCGLATVALLSGVKTGLLLTVLSNEKVSLKVLLYAFTAIWECSNVIPIFAGRVYLERYRVTSTSRAFIAVFSPALVKFIDNPITKEKILTHSLHLIAYFGILFLFQGMCKLSLNFIEQFSILEAESLTVLAACSVHIWNIPSHIWQIAMIQYPVQVIYPFGNLYLSKSSREFWSKWSRPASSLVRYMFYYPLGGSSRSWLSVPVMFLLNASAHYDFSNAIVGQRNEMGWNFLFGMLGISVLMEIVTEKAMIHTTSVDESLLFPIWFRVLRFIVAVVSLRLAVYILVHQCFNTSLRSLLQ